MALGQVKLVVGTLEVVLDCPQWGFADVAAYLEQVEAATPYGILYRRPHGIATDGYTEVRFARTDALIEQLRVVSQYAGRTGQPVHFYADFASAPGTYWVVDWPTEIVFRRVIENRQDVVLPLMQVSDGVPA